MAALNGTVRDEGRTTGKLERGDGKDEVGRLLTRRNRFLSLPVPEETLC
jgi:hypothetical protein